jgi:hypothetical protein
MFHEKSPWSVFQGLFVLRQYNGPEENVAEANSSYQETLPIHIFRALRSSATPVSPKNPFNPFPKSVDSPPHPPNESKLSRTNTV